MKKLSNKEEKFLQDLIIFHLEQIETIDRLIESGLVVNRDEAIDYLETLLSITRKFYFWSAVQLIYNIEET